MKSKLKEVYFDNQDNPKSFFEIVKIEDLLVRELDHDIFIPNIVKFYVIIFVCEGQGKHEIDFQEYSYEEGSVILVRKDQIHKFYQNSNVKGYLLVFTDEFIVSHLNKMESLKILQLFNDALNYSKIQISNKDNLKDFTVLVQHLEHEYNIRDNFSIGITRSVLHIVMTKLFRIKSNEGRLIERSKLLDQFFQLQENVEQECFKSRKVQYYAKKQGVSTKTLNSITKSVLNKTAKSFIDERVMLHIKRLLISTDDSVKEIAYKSGFSDPPNFYKFFKKFSRNSPENFRQTH